MLKLSGGHEDGPSSPRQFARPHMMTGRISTERWVSGQTQIERAESLDVEAEKTMPSSAAEAAASDRPWPASSWRISLSLASPFSPSPVLLQRPHKSNTTLASWTNCLLRKNSLRHKAFLDRGTKCRSINSQDRQNGVVSVYYIIRLNSDNSSKMHGDKIQHY